MTIDRAASAWTPHPGGPLRYRADSRFGAERTATGCMVRTSVGGPRGA